MSENPYVPKSSSETASQKYDAVHGAYQPKDALGDANPRPSSFNNSPAKLKAGK